MTTPEPTAEAVRVATERIVEILPCTIAKTSYTSERLIALLARAYDKEAAKDAEIERLQLEAMEDRAAREHQFTQLRTERDNWKADYEAASLRSKEWQQKHKQVSTERDQLKAEVEKLKPDREHENWMASQLCKVEDALGCANDYDPKTGLIDTHSKVLERIRDLIAAEGEVGDLKAEITTLKALLGEACEKIGDAANVFEGYCLMHRKKGTDEGAMKAQANYNEWKKLNDFYLRPDVLKALSRPDVAKLAQEGKV